MMRRFAPLIWMMVIVVSAFLLYRVKYEVRYIKSEIAKTTQQLEEQRQVYHVTAAEWAYLNRPERLQALADKYLSSSALTVNQVAEIEAIPFPHALEASVNTPSDIKPASVTISDDAGEVE
jgi:cell division protein FtsL